MAINLKTENGTETNVSAIDALKALKSGRSEVTVEVVKKGNR